MTFLGLDLASSAYLANVAVVVLTVILAIVGVFAFRWNDQLQAEKDADRDRIQSELRLATSAADARAAEANAKAADASKGTATALSDAAAANERAAKLEGDAEEQRGRAARAETKAAEAEQRVAQLQQRVAPRRLTTNQRQRLLAALTTLKKGPLRISCVMGDGEGNAFAEDLSSVFSAAGFSVGGAAFPTLCIRVEILQG